MGLIPYDFRFATPENDWEALRFHHLPESLVVSEPRIITDLYEGGAIFCRWLLSTVDYPYLILVSCCSPAASDFSLLDGYSQETMCQS